MHGLLSSTPEGLLFITLTWWLTSLSGVLAPGPVSAMAVTEGARRGAAAGPLITAGHAAAELALVAALVAGVGQVLARPPVLGVIGVVGGVVLAWMGWGIMKAAREGFPRAAAAPAGPRGHLARTGFLVTVSNPYWLLWWATVGATYYAAFSRFGVAPLLVLFVAGHLALDLGWTTFLAAVVGAGRGRIPERLYRLVLGACGVFLVAMGVYFGYAGAGTLARW